LILYYITGVIKEVYSLTVDMVAKVNPVYLWL